MGWKQLIGKALLFSNRVKRASVSWVPTFVHSVLHVSALSKEVKVYYSGRKFMYSWQNAVRLTRFAPPDGYYAIKIWNCQSTRFEFYFLRADHLCTALGLNHLRNWWALTDVSIQTFLESYIRNHYRPKYRIFSIMIDGKDTSKYLSKYTQSLALPRNVTTEAVCLLYYHLARIKPSLRAYSLTIMNYDLDEFQKENHEYLIM